jgi:hypothetical protein
VLVGKDDAAIDIDLVCNLHIFSNHCCAFNVGLKYLGNLESANPLANGGLPPDYAVFYHSMASNH